MEDPSPSKRVAFTGCDDDRPSVCDGITVDEKWERQRVFEEQPRCGPAGARESLTGLHSRGLLMRHGKCSLETLQMG